MKHQTLRRSAAGLLIATGGLHIAIIGEYLRNVPYVGISFLAGALACAVVAAGLWQGEHSSFWTLGALLCAGMSAGYIVSRTVGLPGFREGWEGSGTISLLIQAGFLALWGARVTRGNLTPVPAGRGA